MCSTPPKPSRRRRLPQQDQVVDRRWLVEEASRRNGQAVEVREVGPAVVLSRQIEELDEGVHREQLVVGGVLDDVRTEDATGALRAGVGVHRHGPTALAGIGDHHVVVLDVLHRATTWPSKESSTSVSRNGDSGLSSGRISWNSSGQAIGPSGQIWNRARGCCNSVRAPRSWRRSSRRPVPAPRSRQRDRRCHRPIGQGRH